MLWCRNALRYGTVLYGKNLYYGLFIGKCDFNTLNDSGRFPASPYYGDDTVCGRYKDNTLFSFP